MTKSFKFGTCAKTLFAMTKSDFLPIFLTKLLVKKELITLKPFFLSN